MAFDFHRVLAVSLQIISDGGNLRILVALYHRAVKIKVDGV